MLLVVSAGIVYLIMAICGLIPVCIVAKKKLSASLSAASSGNLGQATERIISLCNCMSAGVLMAMCFLGLLPYSQDAAVAALRHLHVQTDFPAAELVIVSGFFLMMTLEQVVLVYQNRQQTKAAAAVAAAAAGDGGGSRSLTIWDEPARSRHADKAGLNYYKTQVDESCSQLLGVVHPVDTAASDGASVSKESAGSSLRLYQNIPMITFRHCGDDDLCTVDYIEKPAAESSPATPRPPPARLTSGSHRSQHAEVLIRQPVGVLRLSLLYAGVSVHSLFEGVALGVQTDQLRIFHLLFATLFHEALVAFAVGIAVGRQQLSLSRAIKCVLLFSGAVPAGIVLGLLAQLVPAPAGGAASAVLQSLSTGVLLHVTFLQLIPAELANRKDRLVKVLFHFLGFLSLALVTITMGSHRH